MIGSKPYATLKYREVNGARMAYVDEGDGDAIVFQHGQPTSSYVWRNVMPHLEGLGRLVAADLVGMGASEKLTDTGPGSYSLAEHAKYLFAPWDALDLRDSAYGSFLRFNARTGPPSRAHNGSTTRIRTRLRTNRILRRSPFRPMRASV